MSNPVRGRKSLWAILVLALVALVAAGCGGSSNESSSSTTASSGSGGGDKPLSGQTVKVGAVAPLSGPLAASGSGSLAGTKAAIKYLNEGGSVSGAKFELITRDDQGDPTKSAAAARDLASKGIKAILPIATPGDNLAMQPIVNQAKIIDLGPAIQGLQDGVGPDGKYPWVFDTGPSPTQYTEKQIDYVANTLKVKKLGEIYSADPVGKDFHNGAAQHAKQFGITIDSQSFAPTQQDVTAQLQRLKSGGAQALAIWTYGTPLVSVAQSLSKMGWSPPIVTVLGATDPAVLGLLKKQAPGVLKKMVSGPLATAYISDQPGAAPSNELAKKWAEYTPKVTGRKLNGNDYVGIYMWDALIALDQGMKAAGSSDPAKVQSVFNQQPIQISQGKTSWPQNPAEGVSSADLGIFQTGSDLSSGTGLAPKGSG